MNLGEYITTRASQVARDTLDRVAAGDIRSLGEMEEYVHAQLGDVMDSISSIFSGEAISTLTQPAVQKAIDTMKPAILEALKDYTPTFAAVSGGMLALAVLLGVWVSNETKYRTARRRR